MFRALIDDIDGIRRRDPAARSRLEVLLCYPSLHAVLLHRLAKWFWTRGMTLAGRWISQIGRFLTGIEIHPGATVGRRFFADHGMGVVIGETAEIGDDVTLYHDVTLGGVLPSVNSAAQAGHKRHPTLEDGVIVGSGAQILGAITVGAGARVGANAVVVANVAPGTTVVGIPARVAGRSQPREAEAGNFAAYGMTAGVAADPLLKALEDLQGQIATLQARVAELEGQQPMERRFTGTAGF